MNDKARLPHKSRIKNAMDFALIKLPKQSLETLIKALNNKGINIVLRQNAYSVIYGVTYVYHQTKCFFTAVNSVNDTVQRYFET